MPIHVTSTAQCALLKAHKADNCRICQGQRHARRQDQSAGFL